MKYGGLGIYLLVWAIFPLSVGFSETDLLSEEVQEVEVVEVGSANKVGDHSENLEISDSNVDNPLSKRRPKFRISSAQFQYKPERAFKHIREYFTGKEYKAGQLILRTYPESRAGMYFSFIVSPSVNRLPDGSQLILKWIQTDSAEVNQREFLLRDIEDVRSEIFVGLTGVDWANQELKITAWQISIISPGGEILAEEQSFLWKM